MQQRIEIETPSETSIAIVGMAGRFPGAPNVEALWDNLRAGVESIRTFSDEQLRANGVSEETLSDPGYVKAAALLEGADLFDGDYFSFSPREAEHIDPQHRLFLECSVEALESAGYCASAYDGSIGVFGGTNPNVYQLLVLAERIRTQGAPLALTMLDRIESDLMMILGGDKDYLSTRVSYKLNLRGPSLTVQTACSTSLVAVHLACQSLLSGECDMAIAGGVALSGSSYRKVGYHYIEGMTAPDGHCRPFDADARGTIFGDGVAVVVLKRLDRALADGDPVRAVIRGSAMNNDGSGKAGYTAPGVEGQASVVAEAMAIAGIDPERIGYIEAHGTGTALGDPIEVAALTKAFRASTAKIGYCGIGSLKSNVGHLNAVAGVAGLIKTVLALEHEELPPTVNFSRPNPLIEFPSSPFQVVSKLTAWPRGARPRLAGVNSFGIGGTNAHVVVEEAPPLSPTPSRRSVHVLTLSGKSRDAVDAMSRNLAAHLTTHTGVPLADMAFTLAIGRASLRHRRAIVCSDHQGAVRQLQTSYRDDGRDGSGSVIFMFPGQGTQRVNMARGLYAAEPVFRAEVDRCAEILKKHLQLDIRDLMYPRAENPEAADRLGQTEYAQPALFVVSYALAKLWMSWGVTAAGMIGHSLGEFVAACLADVFTLEEALWVVAARGKFMQGLPPGAMLGVMASVEAVEERLAQDVSIAAINAPEAFVVSGPASAIAEVEENLTRMGVLGTRLKTSHAFHSGMMNPAARSLIELLKRIRLRPPSKRFVSGVTGAWISDDDATSPLYWAEQLLRTVQFAEGIATVIDSEHDVLLEIGPGRTLTTLAKANIPEQRRVQAIASLPEQGDARTEELSLMRAAADLWLAGVGVDWGRLYEGERRSRVPLPTYPFQRQKYWLPSADSAASAQGAVATGRLEPEAQDSMDGAFHVPSWRQIHCRNDTDRKDIRGRRYLVFAAEDDLSTHVEETLREAGAIVTVVVVARDFQRFSEAKVGIAPSRPEHFERLLSEVTAAKRFPDTVLYLWSLLPFSVASTGGQEALDRTFHGLFHLVKALEAAMPGEVREICVVATQTQDVLGDEPVEPIAATAFGPCITVAHEHEKMRARFIDVSRADLQGGRARSLASRLIGDLSREMPASVVAYRGSHRWVRATEPVKLEESEMLKAPLRHRGVYLITGGLGELGLAVAEALAERCKANLVLTGRSSLPARQHWDEYISQARAHDRNARTIARIRDIEARGGSVLTARADVSDLAAMTEVARLARARFGAVHGIVHAAGVESVGLIATKTFEDTLPVLSAKVAGTQVLERVFEKDELDFLVLFSSIASLFGSRGMIDYSAANAYLDAYANRSEPSYARRRVSINWDMWSEIGMAARMPDAVKARVLTHGLSTEQGVEALFRVLASDIRQVVVSRTIEERANIRRTAEASTQIDSGGDRSPRTSVGEGIDAGYRRPDLRTEFRPPGTEVERIVAELWGHALRIDGIGVDDDFFELGGHSLLALQLIARLRVRFGIELAPREVFQAATVSAVARIVEEKLLDEIEQL